MATTVKQQKQTDARRKRTTAPVGKASTKAGRGKGNAAKVSITVRQVKSVTRRFQDNTASELQESSVKELRQSIGINQQTFARLTGFSLRAITDWEGGKPLSEPARQKMVELSRLHEGLTRIMRSESIPQWLDTPNRAFSGLKPLEVIERGESDRIWRMIFEFEHGIPT
jgi:DNA-binding transcriptional regulator YiaG